MVPGREPVLLLNVKPRTRANVHASGGRFELKAVEAEQAGQGGKQALLEQRVSLKFASVVCAEGGRVGIVGAGLVQRE